MDQSLLYRALKKILKKKQVLLSFALCLSYSLIALAGYLKLLPDFQTRFGSSYGAPQLTFPLLFGTDIFGRSVVYKILTGAKTAMTMGFAVTLMTIPVGVILGALAGFYGGLWDRMITWLYSVLESLPGILLIVAISYTLGKGLFAVCLALSATSWVGLCRMIRGEFMKNREQEYALAAKLAGTSDFLIMFKHILPNTAHIVTVTASLMVLGAIKAEVMLTFLGVGIQDGASWGAMILDAPGELTSGIWWPLLGVSGAMFLIIYALNVIGDALRDGLDPKLMGD
jgi:ABC-type dipeptide/oligopeptide/nickel transport system permease subunit